MRQNAVLFRTHRFSPGIVSEFVKMAAWSGADAFVLLDGDRLPLGRERGREAGVPGLVSYEAFGHEMPVFPVSRHDFAVLGLPFLSHEAKPTAAGVKWANGDYALYPFQRAFPQYLYYWMLDYDVFFNGPDYGLFFDRYADEPADFLAASFEEAPADWMWAGNTDWAYRPEEKRRAFFPAVRLSGRLVSALLERRREQALAWQDAPAPRAWPGVELFVPTEVERLGFTHALLDNLGIFHCGESLDLGENRIFERPDNLLYHPVKGNFVARVCKAERRVVELEREVRALRDQNRALLAARKAT